MENYTSDSSESDTHTIDYQSRNWTTSKVEDSFLNLYKEESAYAEIETVILYNNHMSTMPLSLLKFANLHTLDVSNNNLSTLNVEVFLHCPLRTFIAKNNLLTNESLPKTFVSKALKSSSSSTTGAGGKLGQLRELNLSGNMLTRFPHQVLGLQSIKYLYLNGNIIQAIDKDIWKLKNLQLLSMGANKIREVPDSIGNLSQLQALNLCDNRIEKIPSSVARLHNLKTLSLHRNGIRTLPPELISLQNLTELSLRENPLVERFVQDLLMTPTSLKELSGRIVKTSAIPYGPETLPRTLIQYLNSSNCCVNPDCKGVYFDNRVENVKFIDFCGKYRVPFMEYLCSSRCAEHAVSPHDSQSSPSQGFMMRKVLLG